MVIFVPKGDLEFGDHTRNPEFYNGIFTYLNVEPKDYQTETPF